MKPTKKMTRHEITVARVAAVIARAVVLTAHNALDHEDTTVGPYHEAVDRGVRFACIGARGRAPERREVRADAAAEAFVARVGAGRANEAAMAAAKLTAKVDATAALALEREEMLDLLLTTHWDQNERAAAHLRRMPAGQHAYLFAVSARGEGFFLVWIGPDKPSVLDRAAFRKIVEEAKAEKLVPPYHVYARTSIYPGPSVEFYQIPDRILEKLGLNDRRTT